MSQNFEFNELSELEATVMDSVKQEALNDVYKEIASELGIDAAHAIYRLYRGTQINFPKQFLSPDYIKGRIVYEYTYENVSVERLAVKYNYTQRTVKRILQSQNTVKSGK